MDPFWAAVQHRHPDVDLVLLRPPEEAEPSGSGEPAADPAHAGELADRLELTASVAARVWAAATGNGESPPPRLAYGPRPDTVVVRVKGSAHLDVAPAIDAPFESDVHLRASYAEETGTFSMTVESDPLAVGVDEARRLVRGSRTR